MNSEIIKKLSKAEDGLAIYEYMANNIDNLSDADVKELIDLMTRVDRNGQFAVSTARYLHAVEDNKYAEYVDILVKAAIEKDRERKYIIDLLAAFWGSDYMDHVAGLNASDDNFRRIYKRIYNTGM